jgi:hypothetical protein
LFKSKLKYDVKNIFASAEFSQGDYDQLTAKGKEKARLVGQYWEQM